MNRTAQVLTLVRSYNGEILIDPVRQVVLEQINLPFIERGGFAEEIQIAQWCYRGLTNVIDRGRSPKQELLDLIGLAATWDSMSKQYNSGDTEFSLLQYNSAVLHSLVIAAVRVVRPPS